MLRIVESTPEMIEEAVRRLRGGAVVALPTETVYGLGADTFNTDALDMVFELKGRSTSKPLIAHVLDASGAQEVVSKWDERCDELAKRFWPGPLALVLPKAKRVPARATGGLATVAVRSPRHPVARKLLEALGSPISAPSANRAGHVSPTSAEHVVEELTCDEEVLVLDGGACEVGVESTILDMTEPRARILRPGAVAAGQLCEVLGSIESPWTSQQPCDPATAQQYFTLQTPVELIDSSELPDRLLQLQNPVAVLCFDPADVPAPHQAIQMPLGAARYARTLYEKLRRADALHLHRIVIESPPTTSELWRVILDRLRSASAAGRSSDAR